MATAPTSPGAAPALRLFVAAWPPAALRAAGGPWLRSLTWPAGARVEGPARWHLTLLFMGAVDAGRVDEVEARLDAAARAAPAGARPRVTLRRLECWPRGTWVLTPGTPGEPAGPAPVEPVVPMVPVVPVVPMVPAATDEASNLAALAAWRAALAQSLLEAGLPCDARPLRPHLTLARAAPGARLPAAPELPPWPLSGFALVASDGGRYRTLARYAFGPGRVDDGTGGRRSAARSGGR